MTVKSNWIHIIVNFLSILGANAQVEFQDIKEFNTLLTFENIAIDWKGDGRTQLLLNDGINNLNENKPEAAIPNFDEILNTNPDFWIALYYRGICYKRQYNVIKAKSDFQKLIALRGDLPQAYLEMSKVKVLAGYTNDAVKFLTTCIEKFPHYVSAYYLMGDVCLITKDLEKAKSYYQSCEKITANFLPAKVKLGLIEVAMTKDPEAGLKFFNEVIKTDSLQQEALWCRATLFSNRNFGKSLADLNTLIRHNPANLHFLFQRGKILVELKDFEGAWRDFHKLIATTQINQNSFTAIDRRIGIQNAGHYLVRQVHGLNEKQQSEIKKSYCLMFVGRDQEALFTISRIKTLTKTALWQYLSGIIYEHLGQDIEAQKHYGLAIKLDPEIFDAYQKRGIYLSNVRDWPGAEKDFTEMIRISPRSKSGYKLRSVVRYFKQDFTHSIEDANKVLQIDSSDCEIRQTLALSQIAANNFLKGVDALYYCHDIAIHNLDLVKLHEAIKQLLNAGDSVNAMGYLTRMTDARPLYEAGTRLKIEILSSQKKWNELYDFLKNRVHVFVTMNSPEYKIYIQDELSRVEKNLNAAKEKSN